LRDTSAAFDAVRAASSSFVAETSSNTVANSPRAGETTRMRKWRPIGSKWTSIRAGSPVMATRTKVSRYGALSVP
jgi:hypothetical protein